MTCWKRGGIFDPVIPVQLNVGMVTYRIWWVGSASMKWWHRWRTEEPNSMVCIYVAALVLQAAWRLYQASSCHRVRAVSFCCSCRSSSCYWAIRYQAIPVGYWMSQWRCVCRKRNILPHGTWNGLVLTLEPVNFVHGCCWLMVCVEWCTIVWACARTVPKLDSGRVCVCVCVCACVCSLKTRFSSCVFSKLDSECVCVFSERHTYFQNWIRGFCIVLLKDGWMSKFWIT